MTITQAFNLSGTALPIDPRGMLDEICEHFLEHSEVEREGEVALLKSDTGLARIRAESGKLKIEISSPTEQALQLSRNIIAEHLFYFAGDEAFELTWSNPAPPARLPDLHEVTVVSAEDITTTMRRVKFACDDITPFMGGEMHVRLLVPPKGKPLAWPTLAADGRIDWPKGEDEILVRVYTIRTVDVERRELWIDFLQHAGDGVETPGADFARDAKPGDRVALLGPGGGGLPVADCVLLAGDETAIPAIARIAAEVPAGTRLQAIIEVRDETEEQALPSAGSLDIRWLHRSSYPAEAGDMLAKATKEAISCLEEGTFVWVACEKDDVRDIRKFLKQRGHDRKSMYVAWYWEKHPDRPRA
jgi:NADPH-dependent ferric siderophore reductase